MKTTQKKKAGPVHKKEKSPNQQLRNIRDKIGMEIKDMSFEELKKYIEEKSKLFPKKVWQKSTNQSK
ncbi:MAG: hypothetical protein A2V93_04575 [Ignavibacteria bacterium RBG_16_34_14]|nr:MAG: hypothetical protein A2V93_04575 [Ignavibacteria bacterium RBG_16_34_14]